MTPKEKGEELFEKINIHIPIDACFNDTEIEVFKKMEKDHLATKKIVLIAVDEIIDTIEIGFEDYKGLAKNSYWNEVKQEIEKL